jgi:DnaJ-class molecular chaperone
MSTQCPMCFGMGVVPSMENQRGVEPPCPVCHGLGTVDRESFCVCGQTANLTREGYKFCGRESCLTATKFQERAHLGA